MGATYNFMPETEENGPLATYEMGEIVHKTVRITSCIFSGKENFRVYEADENDRRFIIAGNFPYDLSMNGFYQITGVVSLDKKNIRQLKVIEYEATLPTTEQGIITVLQTLHGLDTQAYKMYSAIGPSVLNLLKSDPQKVVTRVKGVGLKRAKEWQQQLLAMEANDKQLQKLYELGLSQKQATSLVSEYGFAVCDEIQVNPYFLMGKVQGYSFKKCDKIALNSGISIRHPDRIRMGMLYVLSLVERRGHCTYPYDTFMKSVHELLGVSLGEKAAHQLIKSSKMGVLLPIKYGCVTYDISTNDLRMALSDWEHASHQQDEKFMYYLDHVEPHLMESALQDLQTGDHLVVEELDGERYVTPGRYYKAETEIAAGIRDLVLNERNQFDNIDIVIKGVLDEQAVTLEQKQMEAVRRICAAEGGAFILNGPAGCGKTFTLNIIMRVLRILYQSQRNSMLDPCILAPTGKAVKVAAKSTNLRAQTIHKAMGLISSELNTNSLTSSLTVTSSCIIVDEFSMVDELLCAQLLSGISKASKVIFLGDTEQLPSIRAGRVLKDLIESTAIPVITLDVVKRQGVDSGILQNANKIIRGETIASVIVNKRSMKGNAYIYPCNNAKKAQENIVRMAKNCGLRKFQEGEVQVLCPLKAGPTGVEEMNWQLQQALNPVAQDDEVQIGTKYFKQHNGKELVVPASFRVGDCVIHTKNDYGRPWFIKHPINGFIETSRAGVVNGDAGIISEISCYKDSANILHRTIYVNYGDHYISYDNDYDELALAYALTIHKSQGSQWPIVICPIMQQTLILNRKLLYTMYTRASSASVLIGRPELINAAIHDNREDKRLSLLKLRLNKML